MTRRRSRAFLSWALVCTLAHAIALPITIATVLWQAVSRIVSRFTWVTAVGAAFVALMVLIACSVGGAQ